MITFLARLHGRPARGVPRWALWTAYVTALTTLPSSVWRIVAFVFGGPLVERYDAPPAGHGPIVFDGWWYVIVLSLASEVAAFATLGLVCEWGERWPRWIPGLGSRRVPVLAAVVPAGLGATFLMIFPYATVMMFSGRMVNGAPERALTQGWDTLIFWLCYGPLVLWGPLLGVLTVHYYRRRTRMITALEAPVALAR
ncbi:hypothetical protein [Longispora albida]|uniref:hypothetical protein n=1 Tax=Longispora albida TaxID=203523 RepID=UPI001FE0DF6B|nr:hypothetical protein [Longispora albida]